MVCGLSAQWGFLTLKHNSLYNPELIDREHQLRTVCSALTLAPLETSAHKGYKNCAPCHHLSCSATSWNLLPPCGMFCYNQQPRSDSTPRNSSRSRSRRLQPPDFLLEDIRAFSALENGDGANHGAQAAIHMADQHTRHSGSEAEQECAALDNATSCHNKGVIHPEVNKCLNCDSSRGSHFCFLSVFYQRG